MIYPGGLNLNQFISKSKYDEIMNLPDNEIETSYKFIQSEGKSGKQRTQLKVQTPLISFSRLITSADKERLQTIFKDEGLKEGLGFSFSKLWGLIKKYGMKILPHVPNLYFDVKDLFGDATEIQNGKGLVNLPGRGIGDLENIEEGKGLSNLPRGKGLTSLPRGKEGSGKSVADAISKYFGYSDLNELSKDFSGKENNLTAIGKSLIEHNVPFANFISALKDLKILPKTGNGSKIKNANILKHINKTKLREVIARMKKAPKKEGGWILPLISMLAPLIIPPIINSVTDLIKRK